MIDNDENVLYITRGARSALNFGDKRIQETESVYDRDYKWHPLNNREIIEPQKDTKGLIENYNYNSTEDQISLSHRDYVAHPFTTPEYKKMDINKSHIGNKQTSNTYEPSSSAYRDFSHCVQQSELDTIRTIKKKATANNFTIGNQTEQIGLSMTKTDYTAHQIEPRNPLTQQKDSDVILRDLSEKENMFQTESQSQYYRKEVKPNRTTHTNTSTLDTQTRSTEPNTYETISSTSYIKHNNMDSKRVKGNTFVSHIALGDERLGGNVSNTKADYVNYGEKAPKYEKVRSGNESHFFPSTEPFTATSLSHDDYPKQETSSVSLMKKDLQKSHIRIGSSKVSEMETNYTDSYKGFENLTSSSRSHESPTLWHKQTHFELGTSDTKTCESTQREHFKSFEPERAHSYRDNYQKSHVVIGNATSSLEAPTSKQDYIPHEIHMTAFVTTRSDNSDGVAQQFGADRSFDTEYKKNYVKKQIPVRKYI